MLFYEWASYYGILMTTILAVAHSSSCLRSITCPCGTSNQNYTYCLVDALNKPFTCEIWAECQTCRANTTHCLTCPPKRTGPNCTKVTKELIRRKRQTNNCPIPGSTANGYRRLKKGSTGGRSRTFSPGQTFRYFCNQGFVMQGMNELTCLNSGTWSSTPPRCSEIAPTVYCSNPGDISFGSYRSSAGNSATSDRYAAGDSVIYYCKYGYDLVGSREITCMSSGTWQNKPTCVQATSVTATGRQPAASGTDGSCSDPGSVENGYRRASNGVSSNSRTFNPGISLRYFCNQGYALQGDNVLTCLDSGRWSNSLPWCSGRGSSPPVDPRTFCPNPRVDPNREIQSISPYDGQSGQGFQVGSQVYFRCRADFELRGTNPITCNSNGQWDTDPPRCREITITNGMCIDPGPVTHAGVIVYKGNPISSRQSSRGSTSQTEHPVGTRLSYDCKSGFRLDGDKELHCQSNGRWSGEKPRCIEDCGNSLLKAGGKVTNGKNTTAGEFPWVVFLYMEDEQKYCGGVLLNHNTVLSAAHCFENSDSCTMYFGKYNRSIYNDDEHVKIRRSSRITVHPEYDLNSYNNDIAIVKFSDDVPYSNRIQPICMPTAGSTAVNLVTEERGYLAGWGENENMVRSKRLMLANLPVQEPRTCMEAYQRKRVPLSFTSGKYCAGFREHEDLTRIINACRGDSGSPMVFFNKKTERYTLEGLVSFGLSGNCDQPEKFVMFTKVSYYLSWIFRNW